MFKKTLNKVSWYFFSLQPIYYGNIIKSCLKNYIIPILYAIQKWWNNNYVISEIPFKLWFVNEWFYNKIVHFDRFYTNKHWKTYKLLVKYLN